MGTIQRIHKERITQGVGQFNSIQCQFIPILLILLFHALLVLSTGRGADWATAST